MIKFLRDFVQRMVDKLFSQKRHIKMGLYGPPNSGKTTLANRICKDWLGEKMGSVSNIPHETREVMIKEKIHLIIQILGLKSGVLETQKRGTIH